MINDEIARLTIEILACADKHSEEIAVEETALDAAGETMALVFFNYSCSRIGIIASGENVVDCDDPICMYVMNTKLYEYAKAEGFDQKQMFDGFDDKIFRKVDREEFIDHINNLAD